MKPANKYFNHLVNNGFALFDQKEVYSAY